MKKNFIKAVCLVFAVSLGCTFASARKFPMKKVEPANATIPAVVVPKQETVETTIKQTVDVKTVDTNEIKDETAKQIDKASKEVSETVQETAKETSQNATETINTVQENAQDVTKEIKLETPAETSTKTPEAEAPVVQTEGTVIEKKEGTIFDLVKPVAPAQKQTK